MVPIRVLSAFILIFYYCFVNFNLVVGSAEDEFIKKFQQHDYKVQFTWGELVGFNKSIFKNFNAVTFKYNRSLTVVNVTWELKIDLDHMKTTVIIQAHKFLSNEYRVFPLRFQINLCSAFQHNLAGSREAISCGNVTTSCHLKKDQVYHICNAHPDESKFPPLIPNGEYKIECTLINKKAVMATVNAYGTVTRPIKMP